MYVCICICVHVCMCVQKSVCMCSRPEATFNRIGSSQEGHRISSGSSEEFVGDQKKNRVDARIASVKSRPLEDPLVCLCAAESHLLVFGSPVHWRGIIAG